jgi:phosphatidylserine decarboxylase
MIEYIITSLAISLILFILVALKWRIKIKIAVIASVIIGILTGFIVSLIDYLTGGLSKLIILIIQPAILVLIVFTTIMARFYRDPERYPKETGKVIISPADGKIIYINSIEKSSGLVSTKGKRKFKIDEITSTNVFNDMAYLIGIDMTILDVHVNRAPIQGKIVFSKHTEGKFISLRKQESEVVNERMTTVVDNGLFKVCIIQIASRLVRKIISYHHEGDNLVVGQRIGAIVFGSQVDTAIPALDNLKIDVKVGDEVKAGVSIIARYG